MEPESIDISLLSHSFGNKTCFGPGKGDQGSDEDSFNGIFTPLTNYIFSCPGSSIRDLVGHDPNREVERKKHGS